MVEIMVPVTTRFQFGLTISVKIDQLIVLSSVSYTKS